MPAPEVQIGSSGYTHRDQQIPLARVFSPGGRRETADFVRHSSSVNRRMVCAGVNWPARTAPKKPPRRAPMPAHRPPSRLSQPRICRAPVSFMPAANTKARPARKRWEATPTSWCGCRSRSSIPIRLSMSMAPGKPRRTGSRRPTGVRAGPTTSRSRDTCSIWWIRRPAGVRRTFPTVDGNLTIRTAPNLEEIFTASAKKGNFPRAHLHNQFPGTGLMGDPIFDNFAKTQVQFLAGGGPVGQDELTHRALVALAGCDQFAGDSADALAGWNAWMADRRFAAESGESDCHHRTGRAADQRRQHGDAGL